MSISECINWLVEYGVQKSLFEDADRVFMQNRLLEVLDMDELTKEGTGEYTVSTVHLDDVLGEVVNYAEQKGLLLNDSPTARDLFDTKIMGILTPFPSTVINRFNKFLEEDTTKATDYFYKLSCDCNYIRTNRVKKDIKWKVSSEYGDIDITINLSKPEKDPKAIAAAKNMKQSGYPKCQLCEENEGYRGRMDHPARQNLRMIPITMNNEDWFFQYSPYVYYNEHCIILNAKHTPMQINRATFVKLLDFVEQFPHYILGSNADLPIVGGSILTHDHFQGGHYEFAMARATAEKSISFKGFEDVRACIVKWPLSVIRLQSVDKQRIIELADRILKSWRGYSDEAAGIFAETEGEKHNTITPIARVKNGAFELDLVLRNNLTTEEHPLGVFHPHAEKHHIKKENIGLIEVMGCAILPARLKTELKTCKEVLVNKVPVSEYPDEIASHSEWLTMIQKKYPEISSSNIDEIIEKEVGLVFVGVLEDAGVYKCSSEGREGFLRFIESVNSVC